MSTLRLVFHLQPPKALQVGDIVFGTPIDTSHSSGFTKSTGETYRIGSVKSIYYNDGSEDTPNSVAGWRVEVNTDGTIPQPSDNDYFYFVKNSKVNTSGVSGYYAEVKFTNDGLNEAELFSIGSDVTESSK